MTLKDFQMGNNLSSILLWNKADLLAEDEMNNDLVIKNLGKISQKTHKDGN